MVYVVINQLKTVAMVADGGSIFLWNVGIYLRVDTALQTRKLTDVSTIKKYEVSNNIIWKTWAGLIFCLLSQFFERQEFRSRIISETIISFDVSMTPDSCVEGQGPLEGIFPHRSTHSVPENERKCYQATTFSLAVVSNTGILPRNYTWSLNAQMEFVFMRT